MDKITLERGKYFGYPECCIKWFSEERMEKHPAHHAPLTPMQEAAHGFRGFIPCPECAEKITHDTVHELIKDRKCPFEYPATSYTEMLEVKRKNLKSLK